jgi:hypothetical protein
MKISRVLPVVGILTLLACDPAFTQGFAIPPGAGAGVYRPPAGSRWRNPTYPSWYAAPTYPSWRAAQPRKPRWKKPVGSW